MKLSQLCRVSITKTVDSITTTATWILQISLECHETCLPVPQEIYSWAPGRTMTKS
ncbi:conserved hypothetical protein [Ricinus communis]|uniref:Uncharacterized protein n=1 Tax=Ricinus communis TaxID=3988 RepID=B9T750_RICCO|nr:conserved hypothetical protein [Ricinus communis]